MLTEKLKCLLMIDKQNKSLTLAKKAFLFADLTTLKIKSVFLLEMNKTLKIEIVLDVAEELL